MAQLWLILLVCKKNENVLYDEIIKQKFFSERHRIRFFKLVFPVGTLNIYMTLNLSSSTEKREDIQVQKSHSTTQQDLDSNSLVKEENLLPK